MSAVFLKLLNMSITASWLILVVIIARMLLKKAPKWISCVLWALVAIRLICPFSLESGLSLVPSSETIPLDMEKMKVPAIASGIQAIDNAVNPAISGSLAPDPFSSADPLQILIPILTAVWLIGMSAMVLYALVSYVRLRKSVGASIQVKDNVLACDEVKSPFILGIIRPLIYVPSSMAGTDLDYVMTHEAAHIKRHDHWWKPLGFLLLAVYWFNPLCWAAYVLMCRDIEMACDEKVIKEMGDSARAAYSQALLNCSFPRRRIAACPLAFGEVDVKERVRSVLNYRKPAFWAVTVALAVCLIIALCFLTDPFTETSLSGKLGVSMDAAVMEANRSPYSDGHFSAIDYDVMRIRKTKDTTTVYAHVFYEEYSFDGTDIKLESGSNIPTVVTFDTSDDGSASSAYDVIEYWIPRDGSYYGKDIRDKFPMLLWSKAFDVSGAKGQQENCRRAAEEYYSAESFTYGTGAADGPAADPPEDASGETEKKLYTYNVAYANWTDDNRIYLGTLNGERMIDSSVLHLPIYKFDTKSELDSFKENFGDILVMDQGYDEVPSFEYITAAYDDAFFDKYSLILAYISTSSCTYRFGVSDVYCDDQTFCMYVEELIHPETYDAAMGGWFAVVEVDKEDIAGCSSFDAQLVRQ